MIIDKKMDDAVTAFRNMNVLREMGFSTHQRDVYGQGYVCTMRTDETLPPREFIEDFCDSMDADRMALGMAWDDAKADGKAYH